MAITVYSDLKIRDGLLDQTFIEEVNQRTDVFNTNSNNAIRLSTNLHEGHNKKTRFIDRPSGAVSRRDITSNSAVTPTTITQDEAIGVKLSRKVVWQPQLSALARAGQNVESFLTSMMVYAAEEIMLDQVNTGLNAVEAYLSGVSAVNHDATDGTLAYSDMVTGAGKLGDRSPMIVNWVNHSKVWHDLLAASITASSTGDIVAAQGLRFGQIPGLGRPFTITDSAALKLTQTTPYYYTLGLVENALVIENSEEPRGLVRTEGLLENLTILIQLEWDYTVSIKGAAYNTSGGGVNPNAAAIASSSNWTKVVANDKDGPGVRISSQ